MKAILTLLLIVFSTNVFSQFTNMAVLENDLLKRYQKMTEFIGNYDTVAIYSDEFTDSINAYISHNPQTLSYAFNKLAGSGIDVVTSDNANFRIYSWDTWTGGTMHFFRTIYQYKTGNHIYTKIVEPGEGDPGCFCSRIFSLTVANAIYYMAVNNWIGSSKDVAQGVLAFTIQNNGLNDSVKLFKTEEGLSNSIIIGFDFFSVVGHPERPLKLIDYNPTNQTISVPVVVGDGQVTDKKKLYHFNGKYFH